MATTQLNARVPEELAARVRASASRAGMNIGEYVASVLEADQAAASGSPELREARARMHAAVAYRKWLADDRSEKDAMSMDEVFGD
ncbi:hypothetical protein OG897_28275 [Streptomyces sp. NBC_00237]|uniref:hypothetical protein n=1 Tax=Streptomyces sp. NBC_00237 TaxID=2975687 RepID=UPI00224FE3D2|nr:hypothetical protein [Streptomyces sp. NBC_00237]MCX5205342.1 hypothetical protein [Streptomyces sp. NBC_00237]